MLKIVQEMDPTRGVPICNNQACPTMSAGSYVIPSSLFDLTSKHANSLSRQDYTWIDQQRKPMPLPAPTYIKHIQTWVGGKVLDPSLFPMDPFTSAPSIPSAAQAASDPNYWLGKPSGFPQRFESEIKNMYKQMFRCYAHLYWQHWLAFWDLNCYRELNTCFVHFINVARLYNLLGEKDMEPMQPLVDVWVKQGVLPKVEKPEASSAGAPAGEAASNGAASVPAAATTAA